MRQALLVAATVVGGLAGMSSQAAAQDQIHACLGPQGQTRIVDSAGACRPSEQTLSWGAGGGAPGGGQMEVVDFFGNVIAPAYNLQPAFTVPGLNEPVFVPLQRFAFDEEWIGLWFPNTICDGPGFMEVHLHRLGWNLEDTSLVYYPAGPVQQMTGRSFGVLQTGGVFSCEGERFPTEVNVAQVGNVTVDSLIGGFTAPFRLKLPE